MLSQAQLAELQRLACECLIIGFNGCEYSEALHECLNQGVGGVIVFDLDAQDEQRLTPRNITSPKQLKKLTDTIREHHPHSFISIDQEGGADCSIQAGEPRLGISRLKSQLGFASTVSARQIGQRYCELRHALCNEHGESRQSALEAIMPLVMNNAQLCDEYGFNLVFAPVVDVHDASCPVIGALSRAYADNSDVIIDCARAQIRAFHQHHIMSVMKHYPGHGRSTTDSHLDITDISSAWQADDEKPYLALATESDMVMLGHLHLESIDPVWPASLSPVHVARLRRCYSGVVISDDYQMSGIEQFLINQWPKSLANNQQEGLLLKTIEQSFNADVDIMIFGNQLKRFDEREFIETFQACVTKCIVDNVIRPEQVVCHYERVRALKRRYDLVS